MSSPVVARELDDNQQQRTKSLAYSSSDVWEALGKVDRKRMHTAPAARERQMHREQNRTKSLAYSSTDIWEALGQLQLDRSKVKSFPCR